MTACRRGSAAIVGVAETGLGEAPAGTTPTDLMAGGVLAALDDAGLHLSEVDGIFAANGQNRLASTALANYLGLQPRVHGSSYLGGASFQSFVAQAQANIEAGQCEVAVIAYGSTQRTEGRKAVKPREYEPYETPFAPALPATAYALAASRHMHEFGTTREHLAEIAVAARKWAQLNPLAWDKRPLTVEDVLASRIVSHPLSVRDCCLVTDGGGAIVLVSAERAKACRKPPVYVLGTGDTLSHTTISSMPDLTTTAAVQSGRLAYDMARLGPGDIDMAMLYDAFTICTLMFLEDLGFCAKGEGGAFVSDGAIAPGGRFPVNTNGGGLSFCHPGMYGLFELIEATRQLRCEANDRQITGAEVALAHGNGGVLSVQSTVILGTEATV